MTTKLLNIPEYIIGYHMVNKEGQPGDEVTAIMKYLHRDDMCSKNSNHFSSDVIAGALRFTSVFSASLYIKDLRSMEHQYLDLVNGEVERFDVYQITTKRVGKSKKVDDIIDIEAKIEELQQRLSKLYPNTK